MGEHLSAFVVVVRKRARYAEALLEDRAHRFRRAKTPAFHR